MDILDLNKITAAAKKASQKQSAKMKLSKVGNQTNSQDPQAVNSRVFVGNLNTFQCSKTDYLDMSEPVSTMLLRKLFVIVHIIKKHTLSLLRYFEI
uniref:Uncharacterized protein LOC114330758 n=1 Tax=Diabrotica virgifera virgifera TaxID=50390 RepID=A0A6P7FT46_DIAVI